MAKIFFERTGGFMGRKVSATIDLEELPDEQANMLTELLESANFFELPANLTQPAMPDAFVYNVTFSDETKQHSVRVGDASAPNELRPLLDELSRRARMQR